MNDLSFSEILRLDFPDFLETKTISLRLTVTTEVELFNHLLRQTSMTAFGKQRDSSVEFHAALK